MQPYNPPSKELIIRELGVERESWMDLRARVERTKWLDAQLVLKYKEQDKVVDTLLGDLFGHMVMEREVEHVGA